MVLVVWSAYEWQRIERAQWDRWAAEMARDGVPTPFAYEIDGDSVRQLHDDTAEIVQ